MPALNFTLENKIAWILERKEGQTIRPDGKRVYKPGGKLYLYAHQRTKRCYKLGEAVCSEVMPVTLLLARRTNNKKRIDLYGNFARTISYNEFAQTDGFGSFIEMEDFFISTYNLKPGDCKEMVVITWRNFKLEVK